MKPPCKRSWASVAMTWGCGMWHELGGNPFASSFNCKIIIAQFPCEIDKKKPCIDLFLRSLKHVFPCLIKCSIFLKNFHGYYINPTWCLQGGDADHKATLTSALATRRERHQGCLATLAPPQRLGTVLPRHVAGRDVKKLRSVTWKWGLCLSKSFVLHSSVTMTSYILLILVCKVFYIMKRVIQLYKGSIWAPGIFQEECLHTMDLHSLAQEQFLLMSHIQQYDFKTTYDTDLTIIKQWMM